MISDISKSVLSESMNKIQTEIADLDNTLAPLLAQKEKLDAQIIALEGRKADLVKNSSDIDIDVKGDK